MHRRHLWGLSIHNAFHLLRSKKNQRHFAFSAFSLVGDDSTQRLKKICETSIWIISLHNLGWNKHPILWSVNIFFKYHRIKATDFHQISPPCLRRHLVLWPGNTTWHLRTHNRHEHTQLEKVLCTCPHAILLTLHPLVSCIHSSAVIGLVFPVTCG